MSHTCPPLSATQFSSHKAHKSRFRILLSRCSEDIRTSALNALNPFIIVVSVITVASAVTALQAHLFFFPVDPEFFTRSCLIGLFSFSTDETFFQYTYLYGKQRSSIRCSFHIYSCRTNCWIFSNFVCREYIRGLTVMLMLIMCS
jgi:hypothetical protein